MTTVRVPYDPELEAALEVINEQMPSSVTPQLIQTMRAAELEVALSIEELVGDRAIEWEEIEIPGAVGAPAMKATVFRPEGHTRPGPGIVHTHGGGMILGDRFVSADLYLDWVTDFDAVVVTFDYRLAPEHPHPAPVEDCYAGLQWTAEHAQELGVDPDKLIIAGASAGGGLAAAVALMARDREGPPLAAQILIYPMLDDRNESVSCEQYVGVGIWDRISNETGWSALLGSARGGPDVSPYAAPARAENLSNLPPAIIDVGSAEVFRDEDVEYATRIWHAGGQAELHVWPGGFHAFDGLVPDSELARIAKRTRNEWIRRTLGM